MIGPNVIKWFHYQLSSTKCAKLDEKSEKREKRSKIEKKSFALSKDQTRMACVTGLYAYLFTMKPTLVSIKVASAASTLHMF